MVGPTAGVPQDWLLRWRRPFGVVVLALVAAIGMLAQPRPALSGVGLAVLLALAGVLACGALLLLGPAGNRQPARLDGLLFAVVTASSLVLVWIEPNGAGFFGGFIFAAAAASRLPDRTGAVLTGVFLACLAAAATLGEHRQLLPTVLSVVGVIAFYRVGMSARQLRARTEETERLLTELAATREAQVLAATLDERQRLAREMHDVLAHSLSGLLLHLEGARLLAVRDDVGPRLTDTIERAHHLAQSGLGEARQAISALRGDDLPGPEALAGLVREFERDTGVRCDLSTAGQPAELGAQTRLTLYRVAQEGLTNVRKHADAERVDLRLEYQPGGTRLTVEDFTSALRATEPPDSQGYGVSGMTERAELLGGHLTAEPTATGFRVALWVPR
jgi:signal transduction histidine kinase